MEELFSPDELDRIEAAAHRVGRSPNDWIREIVLKRLSGDSDQTHISQRRTLRPDFEDAVWPITLYRRSGGVLQELHHAGCWVPKGGEDTLTTAEARAQMATHDVRPCDACQPERFLTPYA
ncbi:hypothetical protein J7W19_03030 [Streptomyces mobaraensis NBRC 13819 = DSM 40847]|uniref:Uncharacterized protein n=2 Tax=Streptomyces mobaraensis TaxID=35621 RepID=A0A5N5W4S6_STRMB|nr:DUF6233 domain-containing protein [Streptomyces mobaraensis]EMF00698.1 hypothetical protein H340_10085 [Streptomyces mobaraensis NBRC 13819 = DSM 40847]KAB7839978.1 hypothetical protein FRZ00_20935 [Streptomyces mobaraensis]QTT72544.1 hypothetical protein J7W19_03030 [Streptomyces mobaraensis NBRC 13819 = DSM 40847]